MFKHFPVVLLLSAVSFGQLFAAGPKEALATAVSKGKPAILLVTAPGAQNLEKARATVAEAAKKIKGCVTVEMDRSDAANSELVTKYGLAGAPIPLILVFAPNGAISGGLPSSNATPEGLAKMLPSPKKSELLKEIQAGNAVLIVASRKGMEDQAKAVENCTKACGQIKGKATTMQVNMDDKDEQTFLSEMKVDTKATAPVTVVINAQGQLAGSFTGAVDVGALAQAATKRVGGCCPSGSGKSCAPPAKKG